MRLIARLMLGALAVLGVNYAAYGETADAVFDRITENWRWSHYWFGKTGIDDVYVEGRTISALVFWNRNDSQPIRGLCSSELSLCVAYSGVYLDPAERRMPIPPNVAPREAFATFVNSGFRDPSHILAVLGFGPTDFQSEEKSVTLPILDLPSSISRREVPAEATREAEKIKSIFRSWGLGAC